MTDRGQVVFDELRAIDPEPHYRSSASEGGVEPHDETVLAAILAAGRTEAMPTDGASAEIVPSGAFRLKRSAARWAVPAVFGAVALVVIAAVCATISSAPTKRIATSPRISATTWRLTATLTGPQFQLATGNPNLIAGATCTTNGLCFLSTGYGLDYSGGGALYVSKDGGHTWSLVTLPADTAITTGVSCASSTWCAVGAGRLDTALGDPLAKKPMRAPELLVTSNGGRSWTPEAVPLHLEVEDIPAGGGFPAETTYWPGAVDAVVCKAVKSCQVLGQAQIDSPNGSTTLDRLYYLHTSDGGVRWTSVQLPELPSESNDQIVMQAGTSVSMGCPSVTSCTVVASLIGIPQPAFESWTTNDGGTSWQEHPIPGAGYLTAPVSCPSSGNCWLLTGAGATVLHTVDDGTTWSAVPLPPGGWEGISCVSAVECWVSGSSIAETTDSGSNWTGVKLPSQVGTVPQISCSQDGVCVATAIPDNGGLTIENEGSLILTNAPQRSSE